MMRMLFNKSLFLFFICALSLAFTWEIHDPNTGEVYKSGTIEDLNQGLSLGEISLKIFNTHSISYQGNARGFNSILNTPVGMDAIEVISDTEMKAYGWCYLVNGKSSDRLASEYYFESREDHLKWFYGYAHYKNGKWLSYCNPKI